MLRKIQFRLVDIQRQRMIQNIVERQQKSHRNVERPFSYSTELDTLYITQKVWNRLISICVATHV